MSVDEVLGQPWTRKHDEPGKPTIPSASRTLYPRSLEQLIEICVKRKPNDRATAAGSHWALSDSAIADSMFVETHDPQNLFQAMGKTLFEVVPGCLNDNFVSLLANQDQPQYEPGTFGEGSGFYLAHFETGKRVYQLYAELDRGDDVHPESLAVLLRDKYNNPSYLGPWAFSTLGGAGGQTVFGALTTGTHGGDFRSPPIADAVMALHLVTDGGRHYWIEPEAAPLDIRMFDDDKLKALYEQDKYKGDEAHGKDNFRILRDDDVFNSVLIGAWRFGIVYSVVLKVVRQYSLHEQRRLTTWQEVKGKINNLSSDLYRIEPAQDPYSSRFLQIAVSVTPHANFTKNLAGVTKRWNVPLGVNPATGTPIGRAERVGALADPFNEGIQGPLFTQAGNSRVFSPDPANQAAAADPSFLEQACMSANFMDAVVQSAKSQIKDFLDDGIVGDAFDAAAVARGPSVETMTDALWSIFEMLADWLGWFSNQGQPRLGDTLNDLKDKLLSEGEAGLLVWHMISYLIFSSQQSNLDYGAISYAIMDRHDYHDQSCNVNGDSIEVFFDATNPMIVPFVDSLLGYEIGQELVGRAFVGYISLRFTGKTRALLGEHRWSRTCVVEVAGLKDVGGVKELIDYAMALALDPTYGGILHWGQRNDSTRTHIQARFGDSPTSPTGDLRTWRNVLSSLTQNGKRDGFSNAATRQAGLEVVTPKVTSLELVGIAPPVGGPITIGWDCDENPPGTTVRLDVTKPNGLPESHPLERLGQTQVTADEAGTFELALVASIGLGGEVREVMKSLSVTVA